MQWFGGLRKLKKMKKQNGMELLKWVGQTNGNSQNHGKKNL